jgi:hypothetical protein
VPTGTLSPVGRQQFFDDNGLPLAAGLLYTYVTGTTTPATTYSDGGMTTPNSNPIVLDAAGRCAIYLPTTPIFKYLLKTSAGATVWTADPVQSVGSAPVSGLGEVDFMGGDSTSPVTSTSYPTGATVDKTHAGTAVISLDSATLAAGTYVLEGMLLSVGGITVTGALVNLTDGAPDVPLVTIASTNANGERVQSSAITFASGGAAKSYAIKMKVSGGSGFGWAFRLVRTV